MYIRHQLQPRVLYIVLMCMSSVLCVQVQKDTSLSISCLICGSLQLREFRRTAPEVNNGACPQSPVPFISVPPAAAANKAAGKVGFALASRHAQAPLSPNLPTAERQRCQGKAGCLPGPASGRPPGRGRGRERGRGTNPGACGAGGQRPDSLSHHVVGSGEG